MRHHDDDHPLITGICPKCERRDGTTEEQYSFGIYAGIMCRRCAIRGFRDACGHLDGQQGDPNDLDEPIDPDPENGYAEG